MKATEINLQICKNLGNYETVRYSVTCVLDEGEKVDFAPIKDKIEEQHRKMYAGAKLCNNKN